MKASELFKLIVADIEAANVLPGYKLRKRDSTFILKTAWGQIFAELDHWSYCGYVLTVRIVFQVRYEALHKWFEKFSKLTIRDQRDRGTFFSSPNCPVKKTFDFYQDGSNYREECTSLIDTLRTMAEYTQRTYATLEKGFEKEILPLLRGEAQMPDTAEWAFHYLAFCRLCAPELYDEFKAMVLKRLEELNNRNEPNVIKYYADLDKILAYMEAPGNLKL